jgi:hypothetical protein
MPRSLVVCLIMLGLLLSGCASHQSAARVPLTSEESVCWEPPPEKPIHPIRHWCKEHARAVAFGATVLVLSGIAVGSALAFIAYGGGPHGVGGVP